MEMDSPETNMANNNINSNNRVVTESNGSANGVMPQELKAGYDADIVRLIGQHLVSIGLKQTADLLLEESGLKGLDHPVASKFQQYILNGEWDKATPLVDDLASFAEGDNKSNINEMRLLIAEQKFLESIEDNQRVKALKCLRLEITPLTDNNKRIQHFATLLMIKSTEEVRLRANWPGKGLQSRQNLIDKFQRFVPPSIMLPPKRLNTLISQAIQLQCERCNLHFMESGTDYIDLKTDHKCSADKFPLYLKQELDNHMTEVWFCKFSNDGSKLATGGQGGKIIIWDVDPVALELRERISFDCNCYSIACLSWSPNDAYLLACGSEDRPDLWVWDVNKGEVHNMFNHSDDESFTTCSWHLSGEKFAAASIKGNFNIYDLDGNRRTSREGVRVQCLSFLHKDPSIILAADTLNRIKSYAIKDMSSDNEDDEVLEEKHPIMSFTIDKEDNFIAVNLMKQGVHLWDLRLKTLLRVFSGVSQRKCTVYSSFSSPEPTFLASGSEDGNIYIYRVHKDQPVAILHSGDSRCVNCVSWNPKFPELIASVSDDRHVRLWAPT